MNLKLLLFCFAFWFGFVFTLHFVWQVCIICVCGKLGGAKKFDVCGKFVKLALAKVANELNSKLKKKNKKQKTNERTTLEAKQLKKKGNYFMYFLINTKIDEKSATESGAFKEAQAMYTFHKSRTSNVADHFAGASLSMPVTPNSPQNDDTRTDFEFNSFPPSHTNNTTSNNNTTNVRDDALPLPQSFLEAKKTNGSKSHSSIHSDTTATTPLLLGAHHRTQESTSADTQEDSSFVVHHNANPSNSILNNYNAKGGGIGGAGSAGIGSSGASGSANNLGVGAGSSGNMLNITDKSEEEDISALSKDDDEPEDTEEDYDSSREAGNEQQQQQQHQKDSTPGSRKLRKDATKSKKSGKKGLKSNKLEAPQQKTTGSSGGSGSSGSGGSNSRGRGGSGSNRLNAGGGQMNSTRSSRHDEDSSENSSNDEEDEIDYENDPEAFAMQQEMATMWDAQLTKMASVGAGGSDGMQQLMESFMQFNHDLVKERPETAPDMFGLPKELRERPYLELRDVLEALPYNLSDAILREQEQNYPHEKIKDVMIQRGCWPMVRFQTAKGKIISVNINRTVPFSDVLSKLEVFFFRLVVFVFCICFSFWFGF